MNPTSFQGELRTKENVFVGIAVMDEILAAFEETPLVHGDIPRDLLYPDFIGMWRDPGNFNATALEMDKEQHIISD